ncbi:MAG: hypothetical protein IPM15_13300 [Betaproteobacteria bacterium]|nr:hypothetical protein [Betaproteobacteria bacterium]
MDANDAFAANVARFRLLYRLPLPLAVETVLVLGANDLSDQLAGAWPRVARRAASLESADADGTSWEVIALVDAGRADATVARTRGFLEEVNNRLRPDGWIVGYVEHAATWRRLLRGRGWCAALLAHRFFGRPRGCLRALREAGFDSCAVWYVHPLIEAPMGLIPAESRTERPEFVRAAHAGRGTHGALGFLARLALAHLGLGGLQQRHLFFWARKPC